jgi:hypothetical protein
MVLTLKIVKFVCFPEQNDAVPFVGSPLPEHFLFDCTCFKVQARNCRFSSKKQSFLPTKCGRFRRLFWREPEVFASELKRAGRRLSSPSSRRPASKFCGVDGRGDGGERTGRLANPNGLKYPVLHVFTNT